ncbi:MAG: FkbM family methyltransferase [Opitutales bacterium]|nr:FkbM family methyltransferase [Opitutales bacterium]
MKNFTKKILRRFNLEVKRINPNYRLVESTNTYFGLLAKILKDHKINVTLDVGASTGNWASQLIDEGYDSKIVSFEPLSGSYRVLKSRCSGFPNWECQNFAIGDTIGQTLINVSKNNESSSISKILNSHIEAFPESKIIREENIKVKTIDDFLQKRPDLAGNIFAKVDVQGFEKKVLTGASGSLNRILILQLEMGLEALYDDEFLFCDWLNHLQKLHFQPLHIQNAFSHHETKRLLQVDCIFINEKFAKP